jgi:hypothetical protein
MASAGHNLATNLAPGAREARDPAQGAEHGLPSTQVTGHGKGAVAVEVPAAVADHFEAATARLAGAGAPSNPTPADHKSGLEPVAERARDLTEVATAEMQSGGAADTRPPGIGGPPTQ